MEGTRPLRALDGIQSALQRGSGGVHWALLVVGAVLLVILLLLVHVIIEQVRRRRKVKGEWQKLARKLCAWKLERPERELVHELARDQAPHEPLKVVEELDVFEQAVHRYLQRMASRGPGGQEPARAAARVAALREKLSFRRPRGGTYFSTRELEDGLRVFLSGPDGGLANVRGEVHGQREDYLALAGVSPAERGLEGRTVEVTFFAGESAYSFTTRVVRLDTAAGTCLLEHSLDVRSTGVREHHRVEVRRPVAFRAQWEGRQVRREGELRDLSAGGLCVQCPSYYETGEELLFEFVAQDYVGERARRAPGLAEPRTVQGKIIETRRSGEDECVYHVEFQGISDADRQYLLTLVRQVELGGVAAEGS